MALIQLNNNLPGILGLMAYQSETTGHLQELTNALLWEDNSLSRGERELIAAYTSWLNECIFCLKSHGTSAMHYMKCDETFMESVRKDYKKSKLSPKMKSLLAIAAAVHKSGQSVTQDQFGEARKKGASDNEIHDTILIAAAFSMFNRYVDGLATNLPADDSFYAQSTAMIEAHGYSRKAGMMDK
ncbi:peroxidase-related enzyme [Pollutibacter soli]|uniref:carboxymuconolactone decarboxylase family protein n=1 Tax=Pollutibacter soli TaxID=3034157 RepID=UPI0030135A95